MQQNNHHSTTTSTPTIALLHWGNVWEDFLDPLDVSLEAFCQQGPGGWMLGYIAALQEVQVRTVLFLFSRQVDRPQRKIHAATGTTFCILPAPKVYRSIDRRMVNPYGWTVKDTFGEMNRLRAMLAGLARDLAPYLATPLITLAQELKRENCTAILCQEYEYARFDLCVLLGKLLRLPVFATFQGGDFQLSRLERFIRPHTLQACAGLIVASQVEIQRLQNCYANLPGDKITQIFNPLDLSLWQSSSAERAEIRTEVRSKLAIPVDAKVVVYHGRIEIYRKGLDILIAAWAQLCQEFPNQNWWLLLVGTGSDAPQLRDRIASLPTQTVRWMDEYILDRQTIRRYLCAADLYTLPSRHEGFPVAPLEAMACGLPVVAADAPGVLDILEDGLQSGGIVIPREQPNELAHSIAQLLQDDALRLQLARNARDRMESCFSLKVVGKQLLHCCLNNKK
ncbi:glycosyltransferase family 4 protein [Microcoleus sp. FACHB-1515]|nr:glycosyltransferase family 4 protein [Microcoleus sp. FACHB-1515]